MRGLNSRNIIEGICLDPRIGTHYNNPSFGYGGYCLPKDTKQLLANYRDVPEKLIAAVVESNITRKRFVAKQIVTLARQRSSGKNRKAKVGIYRLTMKSGSDNFRQSSILDVMQFVQAEDVELVVYEPKLKKPLSGIRVENDLETFKSESDVIVANRFHNDLSDCKEKIYSRDIYMRD